MKNEQTAVIKDMEFLLNELHKEWERPGEVKSSVSIPYEKVEESSIMRLLQNMRKQRIRATKKQGRMPNRTTEIPTGIKRIHPFDN